MIAPARQIRFLASVRNEEEARLALAGGADVIDCKEPLAGALGALPLPVVEDILRTVQGRVPVSATIGDQPCAVQPVLSAARAMSRTGVDIIKAGLLPGAAAHEVISALGRDDFGASKLVAVLFADLELDFTLIEAAGHAGFAGIMLDTAGKGAGGLLAHRTEAELRNFVSRARKAGLFAGLAGSLQIDDIARLRPLLPDVLGFRGALCGGARRTGALDRALVVEVRNSIQGVLAEAVS